MGEMLLGMALVVLAAGYAVGRTTTRSRRSIADRKSAKATYDKSRKVAVVETRNAVLTVAVVSAFMIALFIGVLNYPD